MFSLYFSIQAEWESVFSEANLALVAVRKSFYGSVIFLCRRKSPSKQAIYLPVDSTGFLWVEKLKVGSSRFYSLRSLMCPQICRCLHLLALLSCFRNSLHFYDVKEHFLNPVKNKKPDLFFSFFVHCKVCGSVCSRITAKVLLTRDTVKFILRNLRSDF